MTSLDFAGLLQLTEVSWTVWQDLVCLGKFGGAFSAIQKCFEVCESVPLSKKIS